MRFLIGLLVALLAGCGRPEAIIAAKPMVHFPQHSGELPTSSTGSVIIGVLVERDGCLFIDPGKRGETLVIWPENATLSVDARGAVVTYRPSDGLPDSIKVGGSGVTVATGEQFGVSGLRMNAEQIDPSTLATPLPQECGENVIIATSVIH